MADDLSCIEKAVLEKKLRIGPGKLGLYEKHLAALCHRKYISDRVLREGLRVMKGINSDRSAEHET